MSQPKVSIITPAYNGYQYINAAVNSIMSQTFTDFEWMIVDDSSTDLTHVLLDEASQKYDKIKVYRVHTNKGPVNARNDAMKKAVGRYSAFFDIDDLWHPDKLKNQVAFMERMDAGLSYTEYKKIDLEGNILSRFPVPVPRKVNSHRLKKTCSIMASSAMFDTEKTGRILQDMSVNCKDDLHFWLRILNKVGHAYGLKEDLARLRIHTDSWTGNKLKEAKNQWTLYRKHLKLIRVQAAYYFTHYAIVGTIKYIF